MAVKASATITLTSYRDTQSVTRYYKLQPAGSSAPLKPETKPPSSDWTDSEPDCDISKELYFCDLTIFSNGEGEYSKVSKSSSYEAAKEAYDRANAAKDSIDNLEIGGRNLLLNTREEKSYLASTNRYAIYYGVSEPLDIAIGDTITISFDAKTSNGTDKLYLSALRSDKRNTAQTIKNNVIISATEWTRYVFTFTRTAPEDFYGLLINGGVRWNPDNTGTLYLRNVKMEKGNKATDWTPAPEDVDEGIANAQTSADSLNKTIFGVQTFEYILDGVTIPAHKREDGTYYYILNDEEVTVAESDLVHDADGDLVSYQEGGIYEDLNVITGDIDAIDKKVDSFNAREDVIYESIRDNSLIARKNARVEGNSLIITNDTTTEDVTKIKNYLQLNPQSIVIYSEEDPTVLIGIATDENENKVGGYMEMKGTSLFIAQESRLSTIRLRSADRIGNLAFVAGSDGHVSLREVLD